MTENPVKRFGQLEGKGPKEAKFFRRGGPVALAERTWLASEGRGVTAFDTDAGPS